jgi:hypothetical protein
MTKVPAKEERKGCVAVLDLSAMVEVPHSDRHASLRSAERGRDSTPSVAAQWN